MYREKEGGGGREERDTKTEAGSKKVCTNVDSEIGTRDLQCVHIYIFAHHFYSR